MDIRPDFAQLEPPYLEQRDLLFLFENFPQPGCDPVRAAERVLEHPSTLESVLESQFVYDAIRDQGTLWLDISPRLFFNVLLRRHLPAPRSAADRRAIHYLANLLGAFINVERVHRCAADSDDRFEYLVDLVAAQCGTEPQDFLVQSHIGNYALFLSGVHADWIEYRHRYRRRPLSLDYYRSMGSAYFSRAASHRLAQTWAIDDVLGHLACRFEYFRSGLHTMAQRHMVH